MSFNAANYWSEDEPEVLCGTSPMVINEECEYQNRGTHKVLHVGASMAASALTASRRDVVTHQDA